MIPNNPEGQFLEKLIAPRPKSYINGCADQPSVLGSITKARVYAIYAWYFGAHEPPSPRKLFYIYNISHIKGNS